jgi:hypothetical protein
MQQNRLDDVKSALCAKLAVAGSLIINKLQPADDGNLQAAMDAFPLLFWHYAAALTIGVSTATCENTFSCLKRILEPWRSMNYERK